jgi:hypothetical protein
MPRTRGALPKLALAAATVAVVLATLVVSAPPAAAQGAPSYAGHWLVDATFDLPDVGTCIYQGTIDVMQDGTALSGTLVLTLVSGPMACPAEMMASLAGTAGPGGVELGMLLGGDLGQASFSGDRDPKSGALMGGSMVQEGPYAGTAGTWMAVLARQSVIEIPTLTALGLAALVTLLLAAGAWILRRRLI